MRHRILSLMLACCVAISGVLSGAGVQEVSAEENTVVIDVTDYGVYPDSGKDSALGIKDAIAAAKEASKGGKTVTISFPEGRYDIYPDMIEARELYISNTVGTDQNYKMKKIGILLEDMDNVTLDGNGSLFMFHGKMTTFASIGCDNVEFKDFAVDFQVPTVVDVTVESVEGNSAVLYVPECYNYEINGTTVTWLSDVSPYTGERYWSISSFPHTQHFDTLTGLKGTVAGFDALTSVTKIEELGNHRLKVTYSSVPSSVKAGMCYEGRPTVRDHAGTFFWKSTDVKLTSLDIQFLHGFGMVAQHCDGLALTDVDFEVPQGSGRATAGYADFLQVSGCKGDLNIEGCTFANAHDDPINIHGTFNKVTEISADRRTITVDYMHRETAGFPNYFAGDRIEFMTTTNMIPVENSVCTVKSVDGPDGMGGNMGTGTGNLTKIRLTLETPIPKEIQAGNYVVENITYTPNVTIRNCEFKEVSTRGILVTTRGSVLIENNHFDGTRMASIFISNDANGWWESGPVKNVTIRNNTFTRGNRQAILIYPTNRDVSTANTIHSGIEILENTFYMSEARMNANDDMTPSVVRVLDAKSVNGLTFKDNKIYRQDPISGNGILTLSVADENATTLNVAQSTTLSFSGSGKQLSEKLYYFNGCTNVRVENNTYDDGLNVGSTLSNMTNSDIRVENDDMAINANKQLDSTGKIYYESSDTNVVKVSSGGVVTAVGAGTAGVTAYLVTGGRKFPTNTVNFTVNESDLGNLPTGITLDADKENVDVNGTVHFTPSLTWEGEANNSASTVTWQVSDAKTGQPTTKATIENGVLNAEEAGTVVVTASTVNGHEASKVVSIWKGGTVTASDITVEHASGTASENHYPSTEITGGLVQKFGSQGLFKNQNATNVLVKDLPADTDRDNLTLIFKLTGKAPDSSWGDAGMYLYNNADKYVALQKKNRDRSTNALAIVKEQNNTTVEEAFYNSSTTDVPVDPVWLKLVKTGGIITAYYKADADGAEWTQVSSVTGCEFLGNDFKLAIATQGPDTGSVTYSDVSVNGNPIHLVEELVKPTVSEVRAAYDETAGSVTVSGTSTAPDKIVKWAVSDTAGGTYTLLASEEGTTLTVSEALEGKCVKAAYIPLTLNGASGNIAWSEPVQITGEGTDSGVSAIKSSNAMLGTASITGIGSGEAFSFDKTITTYRRSAEKEDAQINYAFAAEASDAVVKVTVNGHLENETAAREVQGTAELQSGRNVIEVVVSAKDQVTTKTYRFIINRIGDGNTTIRSLKVGDQIVTLTDGVMEYSHVLARGTESASVSAVAESRFANVTIVKDKISRSGKQQAEANVSLVPGSNEVTICVNPETSAEPVYYTLNLKVPNSQNADLEVLSFEETLQLNEQFDAEILNYTVDTTANKATLRAVAEEADAIVQVLRNGKVAKTGIGSAESVLLLKEGANNVQIKVTSADESEMKTYRVTIHATGEVWLSDLNWESQSSGDGKNPTRKDKSCGNHTLTLWNGSQEVAYEKGIGSHAPSTIVYDIEGKGFTKFISDIGVDREIDNKTEASIIFKVYLDDQTDPVFTSAEMSGNTTKASTGEISLEGVKKLKLVMDQGTQNWSDHGDWAGAKFLSSFAEIPTSNVEVLVASDAEGVVEADYADGVYETGTQATVSAYAKTGYRFLGWKKQGSEEIVSTNAEYTFTVSDNTKLVAVFERVEELEPTPTPETDTDQKPEFYPSTGSAGSSESGSNPTQDMAGSVNTGDASNMVFYAITCIAAGLVLYFAYKRKTL